MNLREGKIGKQEGISLAAIAMCIGGLFTLDPEYTYSMGNASYITLPAAAVISLLLFLLGSTIFCPPSLFLLFGHGLVLLCTIIAPWTSAPSLLLFWSTALLLL